MNTGNQESHLADAVGPVCTTASVMKLLGVSRQHVDGLRDRGTILALSTADGQLVYPAFQFDGSVISPTVQALLDIFRDINPDWWTVAAWMRRPREEWDGKSAVDLLAANPMSLDQVMPIARAAAARWLA